MKRFSSEFFVKNRDRLMDALPNSLIVIVAHSLLQESADLAYPFRQDSNFWYLTGLNIPDSVVVIDTKKRHSTLLLTQQNDYQREWDGTYDESGVIRQSGIETISSRSELKSLLKQAKKDSLEICTITAPPDRIEPYGFYANPARSMLQKEIRDITAEPKDVRLEIARLRQIKQPVEIDAIKDAIHSTATTLEAVKKSLEEYSSEKDLERAITAGFFLNNSDGHGYEPIIASGGNAAVIHYNTNDSPILTDQLILLDVGAKVDGYSSDISRTWQVGTASDRQKAVFDAVIELQDTAFSILRSGVNIRQYQEAMERNAEKLIKKLGKEPRKYPHGFSHFLGLDVHDAGDYEAPLRSGSVITVEPGLYFVDENIGVRVEDNVLITDDGMINLSANIPREL